MVDPAVPSPKLEQSEPNRLRDALRRLPSPEIGGWEVFVDAVSAVPYLGGPLSNWITQRRQRVVFTRCYEVLRHVGDAVERLEQAGKGATVDEGLTELVAEVLPIAAKARSEEKRRRFAYVLARAATEAPTEERRDEARTMALLLDQLEYRHVEVLDRAMRAPMSQEVDGLLGAIRHVNFGHVGSYGPELGAAILRLESLALVSLDRDPKHKVMAMGRYGLQVTSLGIALHNWILAP